MTENRKILILGAGIYQVPLIRTARRMGLHTVVVSIPGEYPGFALADQVYYEDTRDCEAVLKIAQKEKVSGICTSGTDVAVISMGYVCEKLGLKGISCAAAARVTDKALMKDAFFKEGVSAAESFRVFTAEEAREKAKKTGFPAVIKRVDSSGSRGIIIVSDESQVEAAFNGAISGSGKNYVLIETFLTGHEIGVDGFVRDGRIIFLAPHEKIMYHGEQASVPAGHAFPLETADTDEKEIAVQMQLAITALGLNDCPFNADVMIDGDRVSILEMGGRTGATCIPELISRYYGMDFYEKMIQNAMGGSPEFSCRSKHKPCMAKLLMSPEDGQITAIDHQRILKIREQGIEVQLDYPEGHAVEKMQNGTSRIGHIIADTKNKEEFAEIESLVNSCIFVNGRSLKELWEK